MKSYVDAVTTAWTANAGAQANSLLGANAAIVTANTALKSYVDTQLSTLTNGASTALDTLLEIGTALGNNANFSATMVTWLGNISANVTAANTNISALQANLGATQIWANANIASIRANLGATQIWANANIASLTANLGATQIWANANIASLTANLGSTQIWANANIASLNNSIIGANTAWQSNAAAQQVQINNIVTNANANVAAYLASGNDSTITSLQNSIVYIQGTLSGIPGQALATSAQLDAANAAIIGANVAWQANAAAQAGQITGANAAIVTANTALKTYVDTQLSTLTNGASAALDTLLEIGTALGNNANFSSVMVTWLGNVTANITGANVNISALQSNTGALQNQITGANAAIVTANTAMKAYVDANTLSQAASINSLNSAQTTISGQIGTLQSNAVSQQSAIATLQSQVNGPVFMVTQTTGQSLSTVGSFVSNLGLVFNSIEKQSPGGLYSTSTGIFTPNVSGFYQVSVECSISTANTNPTLSNVYYSTTLYKNSNAVSAGHTISPISLPGGSYVTPSSRTSCLVYLNGSTDYIRANLTYYVGSSGSNWNTTTGNTLIPNYFQAVWLRV
jgi:tetrahydromethanopterin S-methyltransferase subunit H